jgi:hypothetical protein
LPSSLDELTQDHEVICFRKAHLSRYLGQIVRLPDDTNMIGYLDMVGKMHTPMAGSRELDVRLVQMNTLLGPGRFWTPARIA